MENRGGAGSRFAPSQRRGSGIVHKVLKTIAQQANLDRVLFTPALKKIYVEMALAAGGATQFKHVEDVRKGLSFAADKADDEKHILLFCTSHELFLGYDMLVRSAAEMLPFVVLATRSEVEDKFNDNWSFLQFRDTGCIQFHTHTLQEVYNHLAIAYHMFETKNVRLPVLVLHSSIMQKNQTFAPREELEMGNPLVGLESSRVRRKLGFDEALALAKAEKARPTLRSIHATLVENLREIYSNLGYVLPEEGLPYRGEFAKGDIAVLSMVPADVEDERSDHITRLLCYRPIAMGSLMKQMAEKKIVVVIEPRPTPGSLPAFFTEIRTTMPPEFKGQVISITCPANMTILYSKHLDHIDEIVAKIKKSPKKALPVYDLALDDTAE